MIVVKSGNESNDDYKKLVDLYHDAEVQKFISDKFQGTKVEVKKTISEVWGK